MSKLLEQIASYAPLSETQADACIDAVQMLREIVAQGEYTRASLRIILQKHAVVDRPVSGEVVLRKGAYGGDVYFRIAGELRIIVGAPDNFRLRGLYDAPKQVSDDAAGLLRRMAQAFKGLRPETRTIGDGDASPGAADLSGSRRLLLSKSDRELILAECETTILPEADSAIVGEQATLAAGARLATIYAERDSVLLRMNWRGVRILFKGSATFREELKRKNTSAKVITSILRGFPALAGLDPDVLAELAAASMLETHGDRDWGASPKAAGELPVVREGDHLNGLVLVSAGFGRVSRRFDAGEKTLGFLRRGDVFGVAEIKETLATDKPAVASRTLHMVNHLQLLIIPLPAVRKHLGADNLPEDTGTQEAAALDEASLLFPSSDVADYLISNRLINGKKAMVIDLNRCVNCDDCVRACAAVHGGNPRFVRAGPTYMNILTASACMHCTEPVCLTDCPTDAITRNEDSGNVLIDEAKCIGCGACAKLCPYDNIRLVEIRDEQGERVIKADSGVPVVKATKCDYCEGLPAGPACARACPHDALKRMDMADQSALTKVLSQNEV